MNNSQGALYFGAGIDMTQWRNSINEMRQDIFGLNNTVQKETKNIDSAFKNLSLGIAGYFSGQALLGFAKELINIRGEFQKTEIAFSTMLGDANQAKSLMGDMVNLAAKTPFSLQDVSSGAKQLLAFQIPASQVVDTLTRMGNIAAGLSIPLSRINLVYGQVKAKGKLMGDDLRQFTEAGIPMVAELAKKFNKTTAEVSAMVSAGKIGFKDVKDVLFSMTNEGGMFFNLMEKQSASLSGKISNLEDAWDQMLNKIGEANEGLLNDAIDGLSYLVENYEEVIKVLKVLIITYGAYRAALILTAVVQKAQAMYQSITTWISLARSIKTAADAQALFNLTTKANPLVAAITIIALVTSTYAVYGDQLRELLSITREFNATQIAQTEITDKYQKEFSKGVAKSKADIDILVHTIKNENTSLEGRKKAYEKLIAIDPAFRGTLDAQFKATNRLASTFDYVTKKMQEFAKAQARMAVTRANLEKEAQSEMDYQKAEYDYQKALEKSSKAPVNRLGGDNSGIKYRQEAIEAKKLRDEKLKEFKENKELNNYILKSNDEITAQIRKNISVADKQIKTGMVEGKKATKETIEWVKQLKKAEEDKLKIFVPVEIGDDDVKTGGVSGWKAKLDERIKSLGEAIDNAPTKALARKLTLQKEALERERDSINSKNTTQKQLAEIFPIGSIAELQRRANLINEAINVAVNGMVKLRKLDKYGKDKDKSGNPYYTGEIVSVDEAKKQIQDINKKVRELQAEAQARTFSEEMDEVKRQIGVRDKLLQQGYSKDYVDGMFPKIKDKSFLQYLEETDVAIDKLLKSGKADKETAQNLELIKNTLKDYKGTETYIEGINNQIDVLKSKFSGSELISKLKKYGITDVGDSTEEETSYRNREVKKAIREEEKRIKSSYESFLKEHRTFEERKLAITKEFDDLRKENDKNETSEQHAGNAIKIDRGEKEANSALELDIIKQSKEWEAAFGDMEFMTSDSLNRILQKLLEFKEKSKGTLTLTDTAELEKAIERVRSAANKNPFVNLVNNFSSYKKALKDSSQTQKEVKQAQEEYNEAVEKEGKESDATIKAKEKLRKATEKGVAADIKAAEAKKRFVENLQKSQGIFNAIGDGIKQIGDAFGGLDDATNDAINDIMAIGNAAFDLGKSIASGDIAGMISAGVNLIGSIFSALSGDKKKERQIKSWQKAVDDLKSSYQDLEYQLKKTLGEGVYQEQGKMIANLREQQRVLKQMADTEASKKKSDDGKIREYQEQSKAIDRQVDEIITNMKNQISGTDAKDLADKLGDALFDAWQKGEDGVIAYGKTVDEVMANAVKSALKQKLLQEPMQKLVDDMIEKMGFKTRATNDIEKQISDAEARLNELTNSKTSIWNYGQVTAEKQALKNKIDSLKKQLADAQALNTSGSFDGLTKEEREAIKQQGVDAMKKYTDALKEYEDLFGAASGSASSLEGAIKGMSEQTADLLAGQFNAIRINVGEILKVINVGQEHAKQNLFILSQIKGDTSNLIQIRKDISELNSKITNNNGLRGSGL
ncbi:hypothetical protein BBD31_01420 [Elizabethkingia anophelis]|uniref:tape measure protein n=1 Tax=Elizabethkingia anophelis TaxID=1117645 RepID=UPI0009950EC6|nr:tape measure protein [Elizabethkingia anophelis]AQW96635.1 hypothetical protein BBD31_01420 [Elizabethkingia anophelis]OPB50116.1 hypothetical protein BAY04_07085 [Elizabethkingia anophelis]SPW16707.1 tape measure domain [Elizabethkingia anophelis]